MHHLCETVRVPFALLLATVLTVPPEPTVYSPEDDGWEGQFSALGFGCCGGCPRGFRTEWEVRREVDGWATLATSGDAGVTFVDRLFADLTHLERYCFRQRIVDGAMVGIWGPSLRGTCGSPREICFAFDRLAPASTRIVDAGRVANQLVLELGPTSDDGGGVAGHYVVLNGEVSSELELLPGSVLQHPLGPEPTYSVQVIARDRADNQSARSNAVVVPGAVPTGLQPPPAPVWDRALTNQLYEPARWSRDAGLVTDRWAAQVRFDGGLWRTASRPILIAPVAFLDVGRGCHAVELRVARLSSPEVSDWSMPSNALLVDTIAPDASVPTAALVDGGGVAVSWPPAFDACPSGPVRYQLVRVSESGAEVALGESTALERLDVPPPGRFRYRVVATDPATNSMTTQPSDVLDVPPAGSDGGLEVDGGATGPDAGLGRDGGEPSPDAGLGLDGGEPGPDAGTDAGVAPVTPDVPAPESRPYLVGCTCDGAPAGLLFAVVALALRGRRARRG